MSSVHIDISYILGIKTKNINQYLLYIKDIFSCARSWPQIWHKSSCGDDTCYNWDINTVLWAQNQGAWFWCSLSCLFVCLFLLSMMFLRFINIKETLFSWMNEIVHFVSSFASLYTIIFSPGTQPLYVQASAQACCAAPHGICRVKGNDTNLVMPIMLAVPWVVKSFISDPGDSYLFPHPWKCNRLTYLLVCK